MPKVIIGVEQEPRVQFSIDVDELPDSIQLPDGSLVILQGKYASPGDRWCYRRVRSQMIFAGPVFDWVQYTGLTGDGSTQEEINEEIELRRQS